MAKKTTHRKPVRVIKKRAVPKKKAASKKVEPVSPVDRQEWSVRSHVIVPKHEVLSQTEVEELFTLYAIAPQNLPVIFQNDAALSGLDVKMGDIIRITRNSPTAGVAVVFRRVAYE